MKKQISITILITLFALTFMSSACAHKVERKDPLIEQNIFEILSIDTSKIDRIDVEWEATNKKETIIDKKRISNIISYFKAIKLKYKDENHRGGFYLAFDLYAGGKEIAGLVPRTDGTISTWSKNYTVISGVIKFEDMKQFEPK